MKRVIQWMKVRKYSAIFIGVCALILAIYLSFSFIAPRYLTPMLTRYIAKQNIHVEITKIDSYFPLKIRCKTFQYDLSDFACIEMQDITFSTDLFFIYKRTLRIHDFIAKNGTIHIKQANAESPKMADFAWPEPFFGVSISHLKIDQLKFLRENEPQIILHLQAKAHLAPRADQLSIEGKIEQKSPYQEQLNFQFSGQKRTKYLTLELKFQERKRGFLVSHLKNILPIEKATLTLTAAGHLNHWASLFLKDPVKHVVLYPKIKGSAQGVILFNPKHELAISDLFTDKANFSTYFSFTSDRIIQFDRLEFESQNIKAEGNVEYNFKQNTLLPSLFTTKVKNINPLYKKYGLIAKSPFHVHLNLEGPIGALSWKLQFKQQNLQFQDSPIENLSGMITLEQAGVKGGRGAMSFKMGNEKTTLDFLLESTDKELLRIQEINLKSPLIDIRGTGRFSFAAHDLTGLDLHGIVDDDALFKAAIPQLPVELQFDRIDGTLMYEKDPYSMLATAKMDLHMERPEVNLLRAYYGKASFTIDDLFNDPKFNVSCSLTNGKLHQLVFDTLDLSTEYGAYENFYHIKILQDELTNLKINSKGFWYKDAQTSYFNITEFDATIYDTNLHLDKQTNLAIGSDLYLSPTLLKANDGFIWMQASKQDQKGLMMKFQEAPVGIISFIHEKIVAKGVVTGDIAFQGWDNPLIHTSLRFENLMISQSGWTLVDASFAALDSTFQNWDFNYALDLRYKDNYLRSNGKIPFDPKHRYLPSLDDPFKVEFSVEDNTSHLLEYLNAQGHSIRGDINGDMIITGSLKHPQIHGTIAFTKGTYENYATGLLLKNLKFNLIGKEDRLLLDQFEASDHLNGNLQARGYIEFIYSHFFPYALHMRFEDMTVLDLDNALAKVTGLTSLIGDFKDATLKGNLDVTTATVSLPDRIKNPIPTLPLTFINQRKSSEPLFLAPKLTIHLDLETDILGTMKMRGRGLQSKWRGGIVTKGTLEEPLLYGKLEYDEGLFKFAGHEFKFTQGEVNFNGSPSKQTALNLQAQQSLGDLTVTITLRGPISSPVLNLSSSPDLPISMILSKLLFNKDISEIDSFQAIKLAQTALELSSGDIGILEKIQASTGLDRLAITQAPTARETSAQMQSTENEEIGAVAVQVGKYISEGVLITTTQGTTAEARSYSVEIDLKYNLILQLEANQQRDGKLSLKWSKSY